jgi:hypothetical protein
VNPDKEDADIADVLSAVGQVNPPCSDVLENAREVLWSVVVEEMLSASDARAGSVERKTDQPHQTVRQRRPDNSQQTQQRRNASPGA